MFTKYRFNQFLFSFNLLIFGFLWLFILTKFENFSLVGIFKFWGSFGEISNVLFLIILTSFNLHYFMNLVHLATHRLLSKSIFWNRLLGNISAILCGLTLADFASTHLLHHRNVPKNKEKRIGQNLDSSLNKLQIKSKSEAQSELENNKISQNNFQSQSGFQKLIKMANGKWQNEINVKQTQAILQNSQSQAKIDLQNQMENSPIQNEKNKNKQNKILEINTKKKSNKQNFKAKFKYFDKFIGFFKAKIIPDKFVDKKLILTDPDEFISRSPHFLILPFLIFWHDFYFWTNGLWQNGFWRGYLLNRLVQVILVIIFWYFDKLNLWLVFWLLPIYLVGFANGMFLFYFPHYTTKWEEKRRILENPEFTKDNFAELLNNNLQTNWQINLKNNSQTGSKILKSVLQNKNLSGNFKNKILDSIINPEKSNKLKTKNLLKIFNLIKKSKTKLYFPEKFCLEIINISRHFHRLHHLNVGNNWAYFPVFSYFCQKFLSKQNWQFANSKSADIYEFVQRKRV